MIFQTVSDANGAEVIFRTVRSGITKTSTDPSLQEGEPAILTTATALGRGQAVIRPTSATDPYNKFVVGSIIGTIEHEGVGLCQCYGIAPVRMVEKATLAIGNKLIPEINTTATALSPYGIGAWSARTITDATLHYDGGYTALVIAPATAVSGTAGHPGTAYAFIRCL